MIKKLTGISISIASLFFFAVPAFAHVIVSPHQVGIAATQDFTVNVPNEKDNPVISVRLIIPDSLDSVIPYTIPGWTITTKESGNGGSTKITEIDWNGGSIPVGQAAELSFQAQAPAKPTTLNWKAYQTYSDGTVVSWDVNPVTMKSMSDAQQDTMADKENKGEYSTTQVINDLVGKNQPMQMTNTTSQKDMFPTVLSIAAIALSVVALGFATKKK